MKWLAKKRAEVIRRWKANEISLAQGTAELHALGIPALEAWNLLQNS